MSQPYVYKTLTVTASSAQAQNLLVLLQAIDPTVVATARELQIQGATTNASNNVWIGDDQLSATKIGAELIAGQMRTYRSQPGDLIPIGNMWIMGSAGSPKLNVEMIM